MPLDKMLVLVVRMSEITVNLNRKYTWATILVLNTHFRDRWKKRMRKTVQRIGVGKGRVRLAGCGGG